MRRFLDPGGWVLALPLLLTACTAEGYTGFNTPEAWTSADCLACHGTRGAGDSAEALAADIVDTHYDDQFVAEDGSLVTIPNLSGDAFILDAEVDWTLGFASGAGAPENPPGFVVEGGADQCAASCHSGHDEHGLVREQYSNSAHSNRTTYWLSPYWAGFSTTVCLQCHSGAGFALYTDPTTTLWTPPEHGRTPSAAEDPGGDLITCNTCHTGAGMPTGRDPLLRVSGDVTLSSGQGGAPPNTLFVDGVVSAGRSAGCVICHAARESGGSLFKTMVNEGVDPTDGIDETIADLAFLSSHYQGAGATLFSLKAYEVPGKLYSTGNLFHQSVGCVGCHMPDSEEPDIGGHSLNAARRGGVRDNAACRDCHGSSGRVWGDLEGIGPYLDTDGDGSAEAPIHELEGLYAAIVAELGSQGIYYDPEHYPYMFQFPDEERHTYPNQTRVWTETQLIAGFNLAFLSHDTGLQVHNYVYAAQVLRDSLELLTGVPPSGTRPSTPFDRPATPYAP